MKRVEDLVNATKTIHDRYAAGRMEREIVREWVLGLSLYPEPHGQAVQDAAIWFKPLRDQMEPVELKIADLARLQAIYKP